MPSALATGIGLRAPHIAEIAATRPPVGFLEVHTETYFGGGVKLKTLERLRENYPLSFHGVGLSLGSADGIDAGHLAQVADLVRRFQPLRVSEHLSWNAFGGVAVPDLLPMPLTQEALDVFVRHVDAFQTAVGRQVLIENPSCYLDAGGEMSEPEFLSLLAERTGCAVLLDINNIVVSSHNLGRDPHAWLRGLRAEVAEYHLAGHDHGPGGLLIDTHGRPVGDAVWDLFDAARARFGDVPTLIEWDSDLPPLDVLLAEAARADARRGVTREMAHAG